METTDLKDFVSNISDWVKKSRNDSKEGSSLGWVKNLIVGAIAAIALAVAYWQAKKQGDKLAKLLHEKDVEIQEKVRNELILKVEKIDEKIKMRETRIEEAEKNLEEIELELEKAFEDGAQILESIDKLNDWDDIDRFLDSRQSRS